MISWLRADIPPVQKLRCRKPPGTKIVLLSAVGLRNGWSRIRVGKRPNAVLCPNAKAQLHGTGRTQGVATRSDSKNASARASSIGAPSSWAYERLIRRIGPWSGTLARSRTRIVDPSAPAIVKRRSR